MEKLKLFLNNNRTTLEIFLLLFLISGFLLFAYLSEYYLFYYIPHSYISFFLVAYLFWGLYSFLTYKNRDKYYYLRIFLVVCIIVFLVSISLFSQILIRHKTGNDSLVHDGVVLTEEALQYLDQGKNPYSETYHETDYKIYKDVFKNRENPALNHYVYLPFYLTFSLPAYKLFSFLVGFYDQRLVHFIIFLLLLIFLYKIPHKKENKIILLFLFVLNPFFIIYFVAGYNDIFVLFWLVASVYFLREKKYLISVVLLSFACASKQSAWLFIPLYLVFVHLRFKGLGISLNKKILKTALIFVSMIVVFLGIILPYYFLSPQDFLDDVYRYPAGALESSYPISGYGFSSVLLSLNIVESEWSYFPFWIIQLVFLIPAFLIFLAIMKKRLRIDYLVFSLAIFLFIFWFFSRFFNENYYGFFFMLILLALFFKDKKEEK